MGPKSGASRLRAAMTSSGLTSGAEWAVMRFSEVSSIASDSTALRASNSRSPFFVMRVTGTEDAAKNWPTARFMAASETPVRSIRQTEPVNTSLSGVGEAEMTSKMSSPAGSAAFNAVCTFSGSQGSASPISRYSASLADPVGTEFAYEMRGCGEKPDE